MIAIISDIHGNLPALQAVLEEIDRLGCDQLISLGDVTGYYAQPGECLDLLLKRQAVQLLGNHDKYLVEGTGCPRSKTVSELLEHQRRSMTETQLQYLASLSPMHETEEATFVHGGWDDFIDQYLYTISYDSLPGNKKFYFSGHTHVQSLAVLKDKIHCNPGSVGQPRDGNPKAAFAVWDTEAVHLHRVAYDIGATVKAMSNAGYEDPRLWDNLYIGAQIGGRIDKATIKH